MLSSKESIQSYSLRNGDSITVEYTSEADVKEISDTIGYLQDTYAFLESLSPHLALTPISDSLDTLLRTEIDTTKLDAFPSLYHTSNPKRRTVNCLLFFEKGGLRALQQLHSLLLVQPWKKTTLQTQLLEHILNRILWALVSSGADTSSEAAAVSKELTLDNIVSSFLRVAVVPNTAVTPPPNRNMERYQVQHQVMIVTELVLNALGTLTWYVFFVYSGTCIYNVTSGRSKFAHSYQNFISDHTVSYMAAYDFAACVVYMPNKCCVNRLE